MFIKIVNVFKTPPHLDPSRTTVPYNECKIVYLTHVTYKITLIKVKKE